jgi:hypothetical protein
MGAIANPTPTIVIAEMLGIAPGLHRRLTQLSDTVIRVAFSPVADPEGAAAAELARSELSDLFQREIDRRRAHPDSDLVSSMLQFKSSGDRLSDVEIVSQCELMLLAGNLTTSDLIGNAIMAFLRNPEELEKLRKRPFLISNAVEEVLRFDSSVTDTGRIANRNVVIRGVEIAKGESMTISLAAANRDPEAYPNPDSFEIEREDTHQQSFGGGRHFCLGAHLARIEVAETLLALIARFSKMDFGGGGYRYAANPSFRGLSEFWIRGEQ